MSSTGNPFVQALANSRHALQRGNRLEARRWAEKAATLAPESEEPWLLLAALASPRASLAYLRHALQINPASERARAGMHWAIQRARATGTVVPRRPVSPPAPVPPPTRITRSPMLLWLSALAFAALAAGVALMLALRSPQLALLAGFLTTPTAGPATRAPTAQGLHFTETASPFPPAQPTATFTPAPSETPTILPSDTPLPSATLAAPPSPTGISPSPTASNLVALPPGVESGEFWIEVDLSAQRLYAYQGQENLRGFIVSTGTRATPTVTGQFRVYVKYRSADMFGPGYYLPNVPYVMYFYKGYGLHGTYWHSNFGHPMSHGCVNLKTDEAAWLFKRARVGTLVNVHR
ncbi:MAG: L,D-transpeptidase family protein [Chloroflexota bacterium]